VGSEARAVQLFSFTSTPTTPPGGVDVFPGVVTVTYSGNTGGADAMGAGSDIKVSFIDLSPPIGSGFISSPFAFDVTILDLTTLGVATFTVTGVMSGDVGPNSSSLGFTFTSGTQMMVLAGPGGTATYTLDPKFLDVPTVEIGGVTKQGSLTAHVSAVLNVIPEPTTVAMGLLGLPVGLLALRRRARRPVVA
jgi:hypothetical protein